VAQAINIDQAVADYTSRLKAFISKRVSSDEDAEDILQDVFVQLAEADRLSKPIEELTAWLFSVARNRITDWYRKKKTDRLPEGQSEEDLLDGMEMISDFFDDEEMASDFEYMSGRMWTRLDQALDELPPKQRQVFELNELEGVSFAEISRRTGDSVNTLLSRKHYAVQYLRKRLQAIYDEMIQYF
jgi:RNA polymerase sigma factor (sigma-70 family)